MQKCIDKVTVLTKDPRGDDLVTIRKRAVALAEATEELAQCDTTAIWGNDAALKEEWWNAVAWLDDSDSDSEDGFAPLNYLRAVRALASAQTNTEDLLARIEVGTLNSRGKLCS
jgi:hypothetical protein